MYAYALVWIHVVFVWEWYMYYMYICVACTECETTWRGGGVVVVWCKLSFASVTVKCKGLYFYYRVCVLCRLIYVFRDMSAITCSTWSPWQLKCQLVSLIHKVHQICRCIVAYSTVSSIAITSTAYLWYMSTKWKQENLHINTQANTRTNIQTNTFSWHFTLHICNSGKSG